MKSWFVVFKEVCVCTSADLNWGCFFLLLFSLQFSLKPFCGEMWRKMVWMLEFLCIRGTVPAALHAQTKTNFFPTDKTFSCPVIWLGFTNQGRQSLFPSFFSLFSAKPAIWGHESFKKTRFRLHTAQDWDEDSPFSATITSGTQDGHARRSWSGF